jgi:diacylglycerol O-acyltransferase / wax synthase
MLKLSGLDAMFLYLETQLTPMHVAGLSILQPPPGYQDNPFDAFRAQVASRLHEVPSFCRKLVKTPFSIDHPVWVSAEEIDLDYHIRRAALPKPGSIAQLRGMIEHLHAQVLDRTRPLWQFHVIEGLEDGRFALYTKSHHACIDGGAGILAMDILSDQEPTPRPPLPDTQIRLATKMPGFFEVLGGAAGSMVQQQVNLLRGLPTALKTVRRVAAAARKGGTFGLADLKPAPRTMFNQRVGRQRAYGTCSIALSEAKAVGKVVGGTINDVVLTICAGTLRRYLLLHGALPAQSLVAGVPVSLREVGDTSNNNQVSGMLPRIATDVADPVERMAAIQANMSRAKAQLGTIRDIIPQDFSMPFAPAVLTAMWQLLERNPIMERMPAALNVAISNVPGPRRPMYFAGCEVVEYYPVSIATHGTALNITLHSYVNRLDFGFIGCRKIMPDIQVMADMLIEEFEALKTAATKIAESRIAAAEKSAKAKTSKPKAAPKRQAKAASK